MQSLQLGLERGTVVCPPRLTTTELLEALKLLFDHQIEHLQVGKPLSLSAMGKRLRMPNPRVLSLLGSVQDWRWLVDSLRFAPSDRGSLPISGNALVLKSAPVTRKGANIFGVHSRSRPQAVMEALADSGLAPEHNPSPHCTATDCSAALVECGEGWSLALRVEALPERTWFDPAVYSDEERAAVADVLARMRLEAGDERRLDEGADVEGYPVSSAEIVRDRIFGSLLGFCEEMGCDLSGVSVESGCLQRGRLGVETVYLGGRLDIAEALKAYGLRPMLDLPRLPPASLNARGGSTCAPWTGQVSVGTHSCSFLLKGEDEPRGAAEMSWAAQMRLRGDTSPAQLLGVFRPARDDAVRLGCENPDEVRYVVAQAEVGKEGASRQERTAVCFLIRERRGEVSSGWSLLDGDIFDKVDQCKAIMQAEGHLKRIGKGGAFEMTMDRLQAAGVQNTGTRLLSQMQARTGLVLGADILDTRSALYV